MVFRLAGCALGAEVPLLPHDFPERLPAIRRPTQDVLLRALSEGLHEVQPDPPEPLRMGKEKPDRLLSRLSARHPEARPGSNADSIG